MAAKIEDWYPKFYKNYLKYNDTIYLEVVFVDPNGDFKKLMYKFERIDFDQYVTLIRWSTHAPSCVLLGLNLISREDERNLVIYDLNDDDRDKIKYLRRALKNVKIVPYTEKINCNIYCFQLMVDVRRCFIDNEID